MYINIGSNTLVRKKDILRLAEEHNDVELSIYTNSTLIDEEFLNEPKRKYDQKANAAKGGIC